MQAGRVAARSRATNVHLTGGATGILRRHDLLTDPQKHSSSGSVAYSVVTVRGVS
jgi:hypothetical protein